MVTRKLFYADPGIGIPLGIETATPERARVIDPVITYCADELIKREPPQVIRDDQGRIRVIEDDNGTGLQRVGWATISEVEWTTTVSS